MIFSDFGMDTASLAGSLESKLAAVRQAGFSQVMISAADVVGHPSGIAAGVRAVRASGLRVTGLEALRDFEGLDGQLHAYKVDIAKSLLDVCSQLGGGSLLVEASTSTHADTDADAIARDLRKLAILAIPMGIRIAFKGVPWSRTARDFRAAGELVFRANCPNLGLSIDAFDVLAANVPLDDLDAIDPEQIFLVQLSDYMWQEMRSTEEEASTATHFRVFPGRGRPQRRSRELRHQARRDRLHRRLQFRRLQRRLPADAPGSGRQPRATGRRLARGDRAAARAARPRHGTPATPRPRVTRGHRGARSLRLPGRVPRPTALTRSDRMTMNYRRLGASGVEVSPICLGTMTFGDTTDAAEAQRIVDVAFDAGINFIDTADAYGNGASESIVGAAIKPHRRQWILATKVGNALTKRPHDGGLSRRWVLAACDDSLARLATDYIDIYYLHRDDPDTPIAETVGAIGDLIRSGKIRYFGVSNYRGWRIAEVVSECEAQGVPLPVVCQPYYNLLNRMPEVEILPACDHYGIGVAPYSPIARGVLTGKYSGRRRAREFARGRARTSG